MHPQVDLLSNRSHECEDVNASCKETRYDSYSVHINVKFVKRLKRSLLRLLNLSYAILLDH